MAWKKLSIGEIARNLGVDAAEVREKQRLIQQIVKARKRGKLSQAALAKKVGVTQGRIAQIESGIGTANITFDLLLSVLAALDYDFRIVTKKAA